MVVERRHASSTEAASVAFLCDLRSVGRVGVERLVRHLSAHVGRAVAGPEASTCSFREELAVLVPRAIP